MRIRIIGDIHYPDFDLYNGDECEVVEVRDEDIVAEFEGHRFDFMKIEECMFFDYVDED